MWIKDIYHIRHLSNLCDKSNEAKKVQKVFNSCKGHYQGHLRVFTCLRKGLIIIFHDIRSDSVIENLKPHIQSIFQSLAVNCVSSKNTVYGITGKGSQTNNVIDDLEAVTSYTITVRVTNSADRMTDKSVQITTGELGQ